MVDLLEETRRMERLLILNGNKPINRYTRQERDNLTRRAIECIRKSKVFVGALKELPEVENLSRSDLCFVINSLKREYDSLPASNIREDTVRHNLAGTIGSYVNWFVIQYHSNPFNEYKQMSECETERIEK